MKLAAEVSSADQKGGRIQTMLAKCYTGKGVYGEPFFNAGETGLFYKNVGKRTYNVNGLQRPL